MYRETILDVCDLMETDPDKGLSQQEAKGRLLKDGPNELQEQKPKTKFMMFLSQLNDPLIYVLFGAAAISLFLREWSDVVIILFVVLLNAIIGMTQEAKAEQALEALKQLSSPNATVRRDGQVMEVPAKDLVKGDVVLLEAGKVVPADLRLIHSYNLKMDESALTGESVPVEKSSEFLARGQVGIAERMNMAYSSTSVTYGRGEGIVVGTGMGTEIGSIASMLNGQKQETTPLQKRLAELGKILGIIAVGVCAAMFGVGILQGRDVPEMLLTAISLAVAAVPEGLVAVVTIVLALGVQRLVKVNTIVRRLPSVETLGSVSVVCSDKTGTLTQNRMAVTHIYRDEHLEEVSRLDYEKDRLFVDGFMLCNDASIQGQNRIGDPTELALLDMGAPFQLTRQDLEKEIPRVNEQSFDSVRKMMTTAHKFPNGRIMSFTKGATDVMLTRCNRIVIQGQMHPMSEMDRENILDAAHEMAKLALRVLALAVREDNQKAEEEHLAFVGLVGMIDPPRPEAKDAVQVFKDAHIRTVMITGDHRDTAYAIAEELGIADSEDQCMTGDELTQLTQEQLNQQVDSLRVFARVSPEHKVKIVKALQANGYIVSMTGDGVNDAPSLKAADIGVAMGITGTDVAKGAADMVLADDNFATIEKAVEEGRGIYANIKKSVLFLLSSNFGEVIAMFAAIVAGLAAPLRAVHILWVNLITDTLPGLALGMDSKAPNIMKVPPRDPRESLFAHGGFALTLFYGFVIAGMTLGAFLYSPITHLTAAGEAITFGAIKSMLEQADILLHAQTYAFVTLATSQLFHAIGMRNVDRSLFLMNHLQNKVMWLSVVAGLGLQIAVTEIPILNTLFGTCHLTLQEWLRLLLIALTPMLFHEIIVLVKFIARKTKKNA